MSNVIRGDSTLWDIPLVDPLTLEPYPLHACTVWVTVKTSSAAPDSDALYQHWITLDADGAVTDAHGLSLGPGGAAAGVLVQELTPVESAEFAPASYVYDIQVMMADGRITTPINGDPETVIPDVTRAITRPEGGTP